MNTNPSNPSRPMPRARVAGDSGRGGVYVGGGFVTIVLIVILLLILL